MFPFFGFDLSRFFPSMLTSRFSAHLPPYDFSPFTRCDAVRFADLLSFPLPFGRDPRFTRRALARFAFALRLRI